MRRKLVDTVMTVIFTIIAFAASAFLVYFIIYLLAKGWTGFSWRFLTTAPHGITMSGGVFPMIIASLYLSVLTLLFAVPLGVGAGMFLAEYAGKSPIVDAIRFAIDLLATVPSIVFGLFGLALFVKVLGLQYSMLAGALTLTFMVIPLILRISEDCFTAVPSSFREASMALGATKEQTLFKVVLPTALPGIVTGALLAAGRAFGETAAVLYTAGMAPQTPLLPLEGGRTLSVHLYLLATTGHIDDSFKVAVVLLAVILFFNVLSNNVVERYRRRLIAGA